MTPEQEILGNAIESAGRVGARLAKSVRQFADARLDAAALGAMTDDRREKLDAFLKRFEQFYDSVSRRVFRATLIVSGDDVRNMSLRDALNRLEALDLLDGQALWIDAGSARNRLAHDYPLDAEKQVTAINPAMSLAQPLLTAFAVFVEAVRAKGLLEGHT